MLQGAAWRRLLHGVYLDAGAEVDDATRLRALRLVLPADAVATDLTAAWLHGVWKPRLGSPLPLHFATSPNRARPAGERAGSHRLIRWADDVVVVQGLLTASPMRTAFDLARRACLVEAVVVLDAFAYAGLVDLPWFWAYLNCHHRWPGVCRVREAAALATDRARSPGESRLRMVPVLGGLPQPWVNLPYYRGDELIAYLDLALLTDHKTVGIEYDGAYHDDQEQRHADNRRENNLVGTGRLTMLRYDRMTLSRHHARERALHEMAHSIGLVPEQRLNPLWFADPRRPFRW